jgi:hypothetical protein
VNDNNWVKMCMLSRNELYIPAEIERTRKEGEKFPPDVTCVPLHPNSRMDSQPPPDAAPIPVSDITTTPWPRRALKVCRQSFVEIQTSADHPRSQGLCELQVMSSLPSRSLSPTPYPSDVIKFAATVQSRQSARSYTSRHN